MSVRQPWETIVIIRNSHGYLSRTFPALCSIEVLVRLILSRLTISLVTSTSASTKLLCSRTPPTRLSSPLIVLRFLANRLALIAAILSNGIASDKEEDLVK